MIQKSKKWRLSTYITIVLEICIIVRKFGFKLVFSFCRNSFYSPKIYERSHILLFLTRSRIDIRQSENNFFILFLY